MNIFTTFDGIQIAYHDEGKGPAVILVHGFGVDGLGQFGDFERIRPILEKRQEMFREVFGGSPPRPNPPVEGRAGLVRALRAVGARTIVPDMRGFGASDKPTEKAAYADSALARDVLALIDHLDLDAVDVIGFSMGSGTAARLLMLHPPQVKSHSRWSWGLRPGRRCFGISQGLAGSRLRASSDYPPGLGGGGGKNPGAGRNRSRTPGLGGSHSGAGDGSRSEGAGGCHSRSSRAYLAYGRTPENRSAGPDTQREGGRGQPKDRPASARNPNSRLRRM